MWLTNPKGVRWGLAASRHNTPHSLCCLEGQFEAVEEGGGFFGGFEVFLGRVQGFVAEPGLDGAHVYTSPKPAGCSGVPEAVEAPLFRVELCTLCDLLAAFVEEAVVGFASGGRKDEW